MAATINIKTITVTCWLLTWRLLYETRCGYSGLPESINNNCHIWVLTEVIMIVSNEMANVKYFTSVREDVQAKVAKPVISIK